MTANPQPRARGVRALGAHAAGLCLAVGAAAALAPAGFAAAAGARAAGAAAAFRAAGAGAWVLAAAGAVLLAWRMRRDNAWGRALAWLGLALLAVKVEITRPDRYVGHADSAAYASMADGLLHRRGLAVDYVSWYFRAYAALPRPEDHWPPFYSFLTLPFFAALGRSGFAARLPGLVVSCLLLPAAVRDVARRLSRSEPAGALAGLHAMLYPLFFGESFRGYADLSFAWLVAQAVAFALRGAERPRMFLWMGLAGGLAHYAKGIGVLLLPVFVAWFAADRRLRGGGPPGTPGEPPSPWWHGRRLAAWLAPATAALAAWSPGWSGALFLAPAALLAAFGPLYAGALSRRSAATRDFVAGVVVWIAVLLPFAVRNAVLFGSPLYSTQSHVAGYVGYADWEEGTYRLYWGGAPSFRDKLRDPARFRERTSAFLRTYAWWTLAHPGLPAGRCPRGDGVRAAREPGPAAALLRHPGAARRDGGADFPDTWPAGWAAAALFAFTVVASLARIARELARRGRPRAAPAAAGGVPGWNEAGPGLPAAVVAATLAFLAVCWEPINRLQAPATALVLAMGWAAAGLALRAAAAGVARAMPEAARPRTASLLAAGALLAAGFPVLRAQSELLGQRYAGRTLGPGPGLEYIALGEWMRANLPGAVTMTRNPWELGFYSRQRSVQTPLASIEEVIATARHFGVTHLVADGDRPALRPWYAGQVPGLRFVRDEQGLRLYEVRYGELPPRLSDVPPLPEWRRTRPGPSNPILPGGPA